MNCGQKFAYDAMASLWCLHYESVITAESMNEGGPCRADNPIVVPITEFLERVGAAVEAVRGNRGAELRTLAARRMALRPRAPAHNTGFGGCNILDS